MTSGLIDPALDALLQRLAQLAASACGLPFGAVGLTDGSGRCCGPALPNADALAEAFCAGALKSPPWVQVHDLLEDPHWSAHSSGPWRCLAAAALLRADGSRAGVLLLAGRRRARMAAAQAERLLEHAAVIVQALAAHEHLSRRFVAASEAPDQAAISEALKT